MTPIAIGSANPEEHLTNPSARIASVFREIKITRSNYQTLSNHYTPTEPPSSPKCPSHCIVTKNQTNQPTTFDFAATLSMYGECCALKVRRRCGTHVFRNERGKCREIAVCVAIRLVVWFRMNNIYYMWLYMRLVCNAIYFDNNRTMHQYVI